MDLGASVTVGVRHGHRSRQSRYFGGLAIGDTDRIWVPVAVLVLTIVGLGLGAGWRATRQRFKAERHRDDGEDAGSV
jgi:hypothetical protein